jgi:lipopolysaccharide exporter
MDDYSLPKTQFSNNLSQTEPLSVKVVRGGMWVFALRMINRGLGFIRTVILARLLAPEDFGLLGVAMLSISVLEAFSQTGFQTALIQKKDDVELYLDTAWSVSIIRGIVLFMVLFFSAPVAAVFFRSDQVTLIIRVIAISTLLSGFRNIGMVFFQKELRFNRIFLYELSATLVDLGVAITLAFILRSVWALVWAGLCTSLVRLIMSYVVQEYRPHFRFDNSVFLDLFGFSKWVVGSSILVFVITHGDDIFVGKMIGISALGLYQMAYSLSNLPATEITHVISQVTFPAYSKLQDNLVKLRDAYLKVLQITAFISIPTAIAIFTFSSEFTQIFLGQKWVPIVPIIGILVFAGLVRSLAATAGCVFYAIGKSSLDMILQMIRLLFLALAIYPLAMKYGIIGVSFAVFFSIFVANIGFSILVLRITRCNPILFLKTMLFPLVSGALAWLLISGMQAITNTSITCFFLSVFSFTMFYIGIISLFVRFFDYRIWSLLTESYRALKV